MEIKTASSLWDEVSSKYSTTIELLESTSDNNTQSAAQWLLHLKDDLTQVGCQVKELSPHGTTPRREHLESVEFTSPPKRDKSRAALIEEFRYRKECGESVEGPPLKSQRTGTPPDGSTRTTSACEATDDPVAQTGSTEFPASSLVGLDTARGTGTSYSPIGSVSGAENRSPQADSAFTTPRNEQGDDDSTSFPSSCSDAGTGTGSAIPRPKTSGIPRLTHDSKH
eukprot:GHVN01050751.1.p1 GENE.GHVN01050751.1~~GHVN01050751.1.p1  ORF type:complete len:225 (-),score=75.11 GHVN01050751.1:349-1023(-)